MTTVVITQNEQIEKAITEALRRLELEPLIRGKSVAVKPNDTWASPENKTGVTQPDTLRAVLQYLKQFGPKELVVSGGAAAAETDDVFRIVCLISKSFSLASRRLKKNLVRYFFNYRQTGAVMLKDCLYF